MSYQQNAVVLDEIRSLHTKFIETNTQKNEEITKLGHEVATTREQLNRMHTDIEDLNKKFIVRPKIVDKVESEHEQAYKSYLRGDELTIKAVSGNETIDPQGGYFIPVERASWIQESLVQWSPIRRYARIQKVSGKDFAIPVQYGEDEGGLFQTGWTADRGPVPQTDVGLIRLETIPTNDMYCLALATQDMLNDVAFNYEAYMDRNVAKSFAKREGRANILGSGVGEPQGLLTRQGVRTVLSGVNGSIGDSPNILIDLYYTLPDYYARYGTWLMHRSTIRQIREFIDGNGQYLWTPNFGNTAATEAPSLILGRPYAECIDMPAANPVTGLFETGAQPIIFGNIEEAYTIVDRENLTVLRDPYSAKPYVTFYMRSRVGGQVILPEAMVKLECSEA
jgi:HK97 family phage major capsid protein